MFTANLVPGQSFTNFIVYESRGSVTATGRPKQETIEETYIEFLGALVGASQKEIEQWKQKGHPITHKINEFSAQAKAKQGDYVITEDGRQFYIQGIKNPGNMNLTLIYYVEERFDVKKKTIRA